MSSDPSRIQIHVNTLGPWNVPEGPLAEASRTVLVAEGIEDGEVSITLLDDEGIGGLNLEYFQKDHPTDVIAFGLHAPGEPVLGDIYLGFEQAKRQAEDLKIPLEEELMRLVIHGTLHVLGFRHPEGENRFQSPMFRKQEELLHHLLGTSPPGSKSP